MRQGELRRGRGGRYYPRGSGFPAGAISLRSASADSVAVVEAASGEMLGTVEAERAFSTVHPGAIYLHFGRGYEVRELDVDGRRAIVEPFDGDWYTQPKKETEVFIEGVAERRMIGGIELYFGEVSVTEQVMAFQRKSLSDHEVIEMVPLELPEQNFPTQSLWYALPDELAGPAALAPDIQLGALHATEHSQIAVLPLLAMCDRWDIGGLSTNIHFQTGLPTIFIYDGHPGGVGISRQGFDRFDRLVGDAARLVAECPCRAGCPSCVQSPKCGNLNEPLHKAGALELMEATINAIAAEARPVEASQGGVSGPLQISVIGAGAEDPELAALAEEVGRLVAEAGARLVCGGLGGVMEAAARGASVAGGEVIGILPTDDPGDANPHVTHAVATGIGQARNFAVVASGDAVIAVGGAWGTLSEIAFARRLGRAVIGLRTWELRSASIRERDRARAGRGGGGRGRAGPRGARRLSTSWRPLPRLVPMLTGRQGTGFVRVRGGPARAEAERANVNASEG